MGQEGRGGWNVGLAHEDVRDVQGRGGWEGGRALGERENRDTTSKPGVQGVSR